MPPILEEACGLGELTDGKLTNEATRRFYPPSGYDELPDKLTDL